MSNEGRKRDYYFVYTLLFLFIAFFCYSYFILSGTSLIWKHDGWNQYFRALVYYSQYLRDIIKTLIEEHRLVIPRWDFYITEGGDIFNTLHYYVIGDPLALLSVFVPLRFMHYFYSLLSLLRMYLAGITFSELCFGTGKLNRLAVITGAVSYAFCYWALSNSSRHPYFINPMIYLPLIILGIEKIIRKEKAYLLAIAVALAASCNFYFFYMMVVLSVVYAFFRLGFMYKTDLAQWMKILVKIGAVALVGVCMAGVIFSQAMLMFSHDMRMSTVDQPFHWLYPTAYYSALPGVTLAFGKNTYWLRMGYTPLVIVSVFMLFLQKKKNYLLKTLFITGVVIILLPIGGRILNGMSYMTNRWSWAFALLCSYILVTVFNNKIGGVERRAF